MPSKHRAKKTPAKLEIAASDGNAVLDFAEEERDLAEIPEFHRAMRGIIQVKKTQLETALKKRGNKKQSRGA
jgi:hypothetical protein